MKTDLALAIIRIVPAIMLFALHGWGKLKSLYMYLFHDQHWKFIDGVASLGFPFPVVFATAAALAEGVGSIFLVLGLFTKYAAVFALITMLVAVYRHLTSDMRFELAALYACVFVALILLPTSRFSIDRKR